MWKLLHKYHGWYSESLLRYSQEDISKEMLLKVVSNLCLLGAEQS